MKPIAIDEFCQLHNISNVQFSPDGRSACFVVTKADKEENTYKSCLYVRRDKKIRQLTSGGKERSFIWLDNEHIVFGGNRETKEISSLETHFYKINIFGGEAVKFLSFPIPVEQLLPLDNGDFLVVATTFCGYEDLYQGDVKRIRAYLDERKENEDYEVITQVPWWRNGGTFSRGAYSSLFYYHARKKQLERLTENGMMVSDVQLSPDGSFVYYDRIDFSIPRPDYFAGETVYRMSLSDFSEKCIAKSTDTFSIRSYAPGESFMLLIASDRKFGMNTDADFYALDYETLEVTLLTDYGEALGSSVGSDIRYGGGHAVKMCGDTFYFISTRFDSACLYKLEKGQIYPVIDKAGSIDCFDVHGDQLLMVALWDMKAQEVYDEKGRKVSCFNDKALKGKYVAQPEILNFTRAGQEIHGFVLKPLDFDENKKYPVILDIHGGPKTVYGPVFYHEMQYWAGKGYFVIFCNPTGSDGRGVFMDIRGKYGTVDYEDIMAFCDAALAQYPQMDAANFFETGGSYGGFMTNWIIGHTNRFKACASQRSISNWISFCGISDIGYGFGEDQNSADIWSSADKLWWHSPLKYADQCQTPTLFIHAFEDYRCPIDQGYQMYAALLRNGVESRMVCFKGENHELSRSGQPKHRLRRLLEITDWFENHRG